jgi:hypothetical protein
VLVLGLLKGGKKKYLVKGSGEEHGKSGDESDSPVSAGSADGDTNQVLFGNEALDVALGGHLKLIGIFRKAL